jgi:hypothetical protein
MSKHSEEFQLALPVADSVSVCRATLRVAGWQIISESNTHLVADESTNPLLSVSWPARIEITSSVDPSGGTRVVMNGSIFGFGPIQLGYLRNVMFTLRATIAQAATQPAASDRVATAPETSSHTAEGRSVTVNRSRLDDETIRRLEQRFHTRIPDGDYWYDRLSGAWGMAGGPTMGLTLAGLDIGGPLPANASNGTTGVFINGRELHVMDVLGLQRITGMVLPGRYWVDAQGNGGYEGGPALFNLRMLAEQAARGGGSLWSTPGGGVGESYGGGAWAYGNSNTGIGVISDGEGGMTVFSR